MGEESWNGDGDMRGSATMSLFETPSFGKFFNNNKITIKSLQVAGSNLR